MHRDFSYQSMQPGFLHDMEILCEAPGEFIALAAHYDIHAYTPVHFETYDIDFPQKLTKAVPKRQSEFLAGRILACAALEKLNRPRATIAIGDAGSPVWPKGISGSISHSNGKCVCLVASEETRLVGIDIEKMLTGASLKAVLQEALNAEERDRVCQQKTIDPAVLATLIFSAKETLFKALHPIVKSFFGFDAAIFNGVYGDHALSLSIVHSLHPSVPSNKEILIDFDIDGEFVKTWMMLDRHTLAPWA
ncbi:4'-phosphopantetheinyl transferase family protein [Agrobacterium burrii]|uniref:Enterobactin synthase component D n=1 Tax=Agrobacterium burrii TaxID=2815339 RepID=A0ABS3EJ83_9HYPH|nr:4'-phosphopantetheinyl transferase superfamily protein [Agrobacterium burrii]MBO0132034.1 4'-phosphopantetheinyl transferase superfamily protein [Agrobacterium burrii]